MTREKRTEIIAAFEKAKCEIDELLNTELDEDCWEYASEQCTFAMSALEDAQQILIEQAL